MNRKRNGKECAGCFGGRERANDKRIGAEYTKRAEQEGSPRTQTSPQKHSTNEEIKISRQIIRNSVC